MHNIVYSTVYRIGSKESKDVTQIIKDTKFIFPSIYNAHSNSKSSNYNILWIKASNYTKLRIKASNYNYFELKYM